jgi:trans-aconitate methyltransferase
MSDAYNSEMYVAVGGAWQRAGLRLMRQVEIPAETNILDVGCGSGALTISLAKCGLNGRTTGLDIDKAQLAAAAKLAKEQGIANVSWVCEDLHRYAPETLFDLVFCNSTLHLARPGVAATVKLAQWTAPGGKVALQTPARDLSDEVHTAVEQALVAIGEACPFPTWSSPWYLPAANELATTLREAGLSKVRAMEELEPLSFRNADDAALYFQGLLFGPYLEKLPPAKHADFLQAFGEAFPVENGMLQCYLKRIYVIGEK